MAPGPSPRTTCCATRPDSRSRTFLLTEPRPDLSSGDTYVNGPPHELFAEFRRTQPVYWQDMPDEPGYWAVLKHADVVHVAREPVLFSASEGGVVLENLEPATLD